MKTSFLRLFTLITFLIVSFPALALFGGLSADIQKELDVNPWLKKEGIKLRVTDEQEGYVTIEMYSGDWKLRKIIESGERASGNEELLRKIRVLNKSVAIVRGIEGVKDILLTAGDTSLSEIEEWYAQGMKYHDKKDYKEAVAWYRKAAEQGYARAQSNLGFMYENGKGVSKDYKEAVAWFRKAAEQGYARAQANLGFMYENGKGVSQDEEEAVAWYRKAAEQGWARAQFHLGNMYENGKGVSQDYKEAVAWFRKAAEQGYVYGQNGLAWSLATNSNVFNGKEAVKWAKKAVAQGKNWGTLDTLACAYARNGDFKKAVQSGNESIRLLKKEDEKTRQGKLEKFLERLELYKKRMPYTEN